MTTTFLTPSETVLLNASSFCPVHSFPAKSNPLFYALPDESLIRADELASLMITTAITTNLKAATIRLRPARRKTFLGLSNVETLLIEATGKKNEYPVETLEWNFQPAPLKPVLLYETARFFFQKTSSHAYTDMIETVRKNMQTRFDKGALPEINDNAVNEIKKMLNEYEKQHIATWQVMQSEIKKAVSDGYTPAKG
jgi:hypothetical protein